MLWYLWSKYPNLQTFRVRYIFEAWNWKERILTPCRWVTHDVSKAVSSNWRVKRFHVILVRHLKPFKTKVLAFFETSRPTHPTADNHTSEDPKPQQRRSEKPQILQSEIIFPSTERMLLSSDVPQASTACPSDTSTVNTVNIMVYMERWLDMGRGW
jgi:hypothetical protein